MKQYLLSVYQPTGDARRLGRDAEAAAAYERALARAGNASEHAFLERRLAALGGAGS